MRFQPSTTPFPRFFDEKGQLLTNNMLLSDAHKAELLTWVRHNVTPDHAPPPRIPGKPALKTPCWIWNGAVDRNTQAARYLNHAAHAYIYRLLNGLNNTAPNLLGRVAHLCHNPRCVNPDHCRLQTGRRTLARKQILDFSEPDGTTPTPDTANALKPAFQKILEQQETILKNLKLLTHAVQTNQATHTQNTQNTQNTQKLASDLADAVVAELIRVKFDQLIAKAVGADKGVNVRRWE